MMRGTSENGTTEGMDRMDRDRFPVDEWRLIEKRFSLDDVGRLLGEPDTQFRPDPGRLAWHQRERGDHRLSASAGPAAASVQRVQPLVRALRWHRHRRGRRCGHREGVLHEEIDAVVDRDRR